MLTYESLIEQAKSREMPPTKIRGILREYLQILILKELYRLESGRKLLFTGGTYLRLVCGLKRFSEDLDFNTNTITKREFEGLLNSVKNELKRIGLEAGLEFTHWGNVYVSKITFPGVEKMYSVVSKYSKKKGIMIKAETNILEKKIKSQTQMIAGFGEFYPCICTDRGILFADKIDALNKKERGRHLYDIMFMLSNKYPVDRDFLKGLGIRKAPFDAISDRIKGLSRAELEKQAEVLRPFLFDEAEADLVADAHNIIPSLLEKYG
ncbi:MAG: nucleotidyl transferase AbiEii/AbiGii toxin family protein [Candidatus Omnitrophica bacterium]|nr:nucleotidyl transferase AbiEii/AbiGii toxin family protein [Candidatus Omnitrophota bacterium]